MLTLQVSSINSKRLAYREHKMCTELSKLVHQMERSTHQEFMVRIGHKCKTNNRLSYIPGNVVDIHIYVLCIFGGESHSPS